MYLFMTLINIVLAISAGLSSFFVNEKSEKLVGFILTLIFIANAVIINRG